MSQRYPGFSYDPSTKVGFFDCRVPGSVGKKRRRRTVHAETREEAKALWRAFMDELAAEGAGRPRAAKTAAMPAVPAAALAARAEETSATPTFAEFVERYYWPIIRLAFKRRTLISHDAIIKNRLLPTLGALRLDAISAVVVNDFKVAMRNMEYEVKGEKRKYAPSYINDCVRVLKMLLHQAVAREVIAVYPIKDKVPKEKEPLLRLEMSDEERHSFLATFDDFDRFAAHLAATQKKGKVVRSASFGGKARRFGGGMRGDSPAARRYFERYHWMKVLMVFALETGVRRGDILNLRWDAIDMREGWIRLTMEKTEFEAVIPISRACREALVECRRRSTGARVFVDERGRPIGETRVRRTFALAKKLAGIKRRLRFHDCRHTFASRLISAHGVSMRVVATALGHTTTEQTERYAKPSEFAMRQIKTALDADTFATNITTHSAA
jgi:integrase